MPPLTHYLPMGQLTPLAQRKRPLVLLDTARPDEENRRSYLFLDPLAVIRADDVDQVAGALGRLDTALRRHWVAGYICYEAAYGLEPRLKRLSRGSRSRVRPLLWFGVYRRPYVFDHRTGAWDRPLPVAATPAHTPAPDARRLLGAAPAYRWYQRCYGAVKRYIAAGDTYQVDLTYGQHFSAPGRPWDLYRSLRPGQPVPYGAFVATADIDILSFSPELFVRREGQRIWSRPMKGTAGRAADPRRDRAVARALAVDPKNRAENVMIVDMIRNDLGRVCRSGSVRTERLFEVETHPTLHQMTSTVAGTLRPGVGLSQLLRAIFPCGSVTGAPKIRSMEIIAELEKGARGVYCGAIGYASPGGSAAFSVPIRTLQRRRGRRQWDYHTGGGIVWDSRCRSEWEECRVKASFLTRSSPCYRLLESLLWRGRYWYLEDHLQRMRRSAAALGMPLDATELRHAARRVERSFRDTAARKVRILLDSDGTLSCEAATIDTAVPAGRVALVSSQRVDPAQPLLYHKTTFRPWYAAAGKAITAGRCFDAIHVNTRGEVTEGARSNVFARIHGRLYTPPMRCGLLPGVLRARLLASGRCRERVLRVSDLRRAEAVYCGNSVRGLVPVTLPAGTRPA